MLSRKAVIIFSKSIVYSKCLQIISETLYDYKQHFQWVKNTKITGEDNYFLTGIEQNLYFELQNKILYSSVLFKNLILFIIYIQIDIK